LQRDVDRLSAYNQALTRDFQKLDQQLRQVSADYQTLRTNFSQLQADYRTLQAAYQALQSDYANLQTNYRTLQAAHQTLQADYANLQANYGNLQTNYTHLQADYSIAVPPPYIYIQGRAITLTFRLSNGAIRSWLVDFQWLEYDIERGWSKREQLRNDQLKTVILTNAAGAQIAAPDFRVFVDPSPFRDIMLSLYSDVHGDEQAFLYEAWHITRQLTKYVSDTMDVETPRYPFETLLAGGGDCEDTSILLASLLRAAPFNWHVSLVYMDHIHPASAQKFDHVLVQFNTGTRNYYIETTSQDVMEYWGAWIDGQSYEVP
jgi:prefoldin subunit 5